MLMLPRDKVCHTDFVLTGNQIILVKEKFACLVPKGCKSIGIPIVI